MVSLEKILEPTNLTEALKQVVSNKGAPGVDGMAVDELEPFIRNHPRVLSQAIRDGRKTLSSWATAFTKATAKTTLTVKANGS